MQLGMPVSSPFPSYLLTMVSKVLFLVDFFLVLVFEVFFEIEYWLETINKSPFAAG